MKSKELIADALSEWREVQNASDLAHQLFDRLDETELERLAVRAFTEEIRAALRRKNEDGVPDYASSVEVDDEGREHRVYKQTALFDVADYRVAITGYMKQSVANRNTALNLIADCKRRLGVQLDLHAA